MKPSKLLKVISILLIIFSVFGLISGIGAIALSGSMAETLEAAGVEAPSMAAYVLTIVGALVGLAAGILGVMYRSRKVVMIAGIAYIAFQLINVIYSITLTGFMATYLLSFILPLLYMWGWYQSN